MQVKLKGTNLILLLQNSIGFFLKLRLQAKSHLPSAKFNHWQCEPRWGKQPNAEKRTETSKRKWIDRGQCMFGLKIFDWITENDKRWCLYKYQFRLGSYLSNHKKQRKGFQREKQKKEEEWIRDGNKESGWRRKRRRRRRRREEETGIKVGTSCEDVWKSKV